MQASAATIEHVDRYGAPSTASVAGIRLAASSTAITAPFFRGVLLHPRRAADLALAVAHVVETRYYTPPGMLARLIAQRDPVISYGGGMLRLEGFSACCGVYARADFTPRAFDVERSEPGTSNVDFNPPMRAALARLCDGERAAFEVSASGFSVASDSVGEAFERRVDLPVRWVRGFGEAMAHQALMRKRFTVTGVAARRLFRELPRQRVADHIWLSPSGGSIRIGHAPQPGAVRAGGIERLRTLAELVRHAESVDVYEGGDGATAWQLDTADARFLLVLSPDTTRGFSGEGQNLHALAEGSALTSRVRALLRWQRDLTPAALAAELGEPVERVEPALAELACAGLVGYDLADASYFHRELPFDRAGVERANPRLASARKLAGAGEVEWTPDGAWVSGKGGDYWVRRAGEEWRCSCPWTARHGSSRGPCKHILAARIAAEGH